MARIEQVGNAVEVKLKGKTEVFTLTKDQIPKIFDLMPLLDDFRAVVKNLGIKQGRDEFFPLLKKQLHTLIQEQVSLPLSPRMLYQVNLSKKGELRVMDTDYPISPDIIDRSREIVEIYEQKLADDPTNEVVELFYDRFSLELAQTIKLVEILSQDELFALPLIQKMSTLVKQIIKIQGESRSCAVSNWYGLAMPSTEVHAGNQSYFNIYRVVFDLDDRKFYIETQGYLHGLSRKTQSQTLLNIDQEDRFSSLDEEEMMLRIIQLSEAKNNFDSESLLIKIGMQAGDFLLPLRLMLSRRRQRKQVHDLEASVVAILEVFKQEYDKHDLHQAERLEYFFEAIANPLIFQKRVFGKKIVEAYANATKTGQKVHREAFLGSLLGFIPSLAWKAGGWSICGGLSAGGILTPGQAVQAAHGFGGLPKLDSCLTCPSCGTLSTNGNLCSHCGYGRGEELTDRTKEHFQLSPNASELNNDLPPTSEKSAPLFDWFNPRETVGVMQGLLGFRDSISVSRGLLAVA